MIRTEDLRKRYGGVPALDGLDLHVPPATVRGLLGPNGAGKTTVIRILATLLRPDAGHAEIAGIDLTRRPAAVRERIGLLGQHPALDDVLSGRQNLELFGRLHHLRACAARTRADELLERFDLTGAADRQVSGYSGGMRRRLDLAAALIMAPAVLFLDEPTTGLDPRARAEVWAAVRALVHDGTTVLLTTQYLDEADQLAHTVSVLDHGRVVAEGTPEELKARLGADRLDIVVRDAAQLTAAARIVGLVTGAEPHLETETRRIGVPVRDRVAALTGAARALQDAGITAEDIALRRPTLDEVFLHLTGHPAAHPAGEAPVTTAPTGSEVPS